ncbi:unnamed protein product [Linum trigynum]|uniref:Secreted protein n=1 Tax=Linum trigynum TaxID=586398 RepID=A0AAV2FS62_9ROSI
MPSLSTTFISQLPSSCAQTPRPSAATVGLSNPTHSSAALLVSFLLNLSSAAESDRVSGELYVVYAWTSYRVRRAATTSGCRSEWYPLTVEEERKPSLLWRRISR